MFAGDIRPRYARDLFSRALRCGASAGCGAVSSGAEGQFYFWTRHGRYERRNRVDVVRNSRAEGIGSGTGRADWIDPGAGRRDRRETRQRVAGRAEFAGARWRGDAASRADQRRDLERESRSDFATGARAREVGARRVAASE